MQYIFIVHWLILILNANDNATPLSYHLTYHKLYAIMTMLMKFTFFFVSKLKFTFWHKLTSFYQNQEKKKKYYVQI